MSSLTTENTTSPPQHVMERIATLGLCAQPSSSAAATNPRVEYQICGPCGRFEFGFWFTRSPPGFHSVASRRMV